MTTRFRVHVRDRPVAEHEFLWAPMPLIGEVSEFVSFEATATHRGTGTWIATIDASSPQARLFKPGRGVVIFLDSAPNKVMFSGWVRKVLLRNNKDTGFRTVLQVSGPCDNDIVRERLGRIGPGEPYLREDVESRVWQPIVFDGVNWRAPKNSAEFLWGLLVQNYVIPLVSPPDEDSSRIVKYLRMDMECPASLQALPNDDLWKRYPMQLSSIEEAFWDLVDLLDLSVRFLYNPDNGLIEPDIRPIEDVSAEVLFDPQAGNLTGVEAVAEAPAFTRLYLAGKTPDNEGDRRYYELRYSSLWNPPGWVDWMDTSDPEAWSDPNWGRQAIEVEWSTSAESFMDVRESEWAYQSDPAAPGSALPPPVGSDERARFDREALAAFVENSQKGYVKLEAVDTEQCRYGVHYDLGQSVRVLLDTSYLPEAMLDEDGIVRQPVQEVKISCSAGELWKIEPVIGPPDTSSTPYIYRMLRRLRRHVAEIRNRH